MVRLRVRSKHLEKVPHTFGIIVLCYFLFLVDKDESGLVLWYTISTYIHRVYDPDKDKTCSIVPRLRSGNRILLDAPLLLVIPLILSLFHHLEAVLIESLSC